MGSTSTYISLGIALFALSIIFLIFLLQGSIDTKSIRATPSIPVENGVVTTYASVVIHASVDEVFEVISNYKDLHWSSSFEYDWKETTSSGAPKAGSKGKVTIKIADLITRDLSFQNTCMDLEHKAISERTDVYPRWLLGSERVQRVLPVEGRKGLCEYRTWFTHEGVAAYYLLFTAKEDLEETLRLYVEEAKTFVEGKKR